MRVIVAALAALWMICAMPAAAQGGTDKLPPEVSQLLKTLKPQQGKVAIPDARAELDLGEKYLFYNKEDARRILTELWGNPPESVDNVLGLVMKAGTSPVSDAWGAVITFDNSGYVSDKDAADVDYDELLAQLKDATRELNEARKAKGFGTVTLVGWAAQPRYDPAHHSVVWAKNLIFSDAEGPNTLNYDLRTLGRNGVLSMNLVSVMPDIDGVRLAANDLAAHASFQPGARYEDFDASTDKEAEYGIAGLIAAGAGVAAAKKLGILALLLKFLKPILIGIAVFFGAFWRKVKGMFGGKESAPVDWESYQAAEPDTTAGIEGAPPESLTPHDPR